MIWRSVRRGKVIFLLVFGFCLFALPHDAVAFTTSEPEAFEGVYHRPEGSPVSFSWQVGSRTDQGEWRIYRGPDLENIRLIDATPAQQGRVSYQWEASRPLADREYFQLRYLADDGTETVMASVLLVGTEFHTVIPPLPDGPPPVHFPTSSGWMPSGSALKSSSLDGVPLQSERPSPEVPPPEMIG